MTSVMLWAWCSLVVRRHRPNPGREKGRGVFEIVEDFRGDTYRVAYTVRFSKAVYVLHCFQKKSPSGIRTARGDAELIHERMKAALADYEVRYGKED